MNKLKNFNEFFRKVVNYNNITLTLSYYNSPFLLKTHGKKCLGKTPREEVKWTSLLLPSLFRVNVGLSPSKEVVFICFNESHLETIKNVFYFMSKALFVLEMFAFLTWNFDYVEKRNSLIRKLRLISKFMTSQTRQQMTTMHIFPNISRPNYNQKMRFG